MGYLSEDEIANTGFKRIGKGVKISTKASIYDCDQIEIGDYSRIDDFCILSGKIIIGNYCHITPMCLIAGGKPGVYFEDFVTLAYGVKLFSQSDDYSGTTLTNSLIPKQYKNEVFLPIHLGRHVIIGANSTIMPGVHVAEGCSVGAMSLVNKNTEAWGIYFGTPAKRMKERRRDLLTLEKTLLSDLKNDTV